MKTDVRYFKVTNGKSQEMMHTSTYIWLLQWLNLQSRTKVRAQRKFAMNQPNNIVSTNQTNTSVPGTDTGVTSTSKTGEKTSSTIVFPKRAKTEDFLTFLCLRGTRCQSYLINFLVQYTCTCMYLYLKTWEKCTIGVNEWEYTCVTKSL